MPCLAVHRGDVRRITNQVISLFEGKVQKILSSGRWELNPDKSTTYWAGWLEVPLPGILTETKLGGWLELLNTGTNGKEIANVPEAREELILINSIISEANSIYQSLVNLGTPCSKQDKNYLYYSASTIREMSQVFNSFISLMEQQVGSGKLWQAKFGIQSPLLVDELPESIIVQTASLYGEFALQAQWVHRMFAKFEAKGLGQAGEGEEEPSECDRIAAALEKLAEVFGGNGEDGDGGRLGRIERALGVDDFPATLPVCFTDQSKGRKEYTSIPQTQIWLAEQLDCLIGQFPLKITIEDTELDEEGNQSQDLEFPNLAEMMAELFGLILNTETQTDAALNTSLRALTEIGSVKQNSVYTTSCIGSICDYLGFGYKNESKEIGYTFNPKETELSKILQPSIQQARVEVFQRDKKNLTLAEQLSFLMRGAAAIEAFTGFTAKSGEDAASQVQAIRSQQQNLGDDSFEFDLWTEKAERGFTTEAGIRDPIHPFGRDFNRRARIREIGIDGDTREDQ